MIFREMDVQSFVRFSTPYTLPLDDQGLILVEGENQDAPVESPSNGAGKSLAVVETLLWCLYEKMARYGNTKIASQCLHPRLGADVSVTVEVAPGHEYVIERTRGIRGASQLRSPDADHQVPQSKDASRRQEDLDALLGLDYEAFRNLVVVQGGESLAAAGFAQQMRVLEQVLRVDEFEAPWNLARAAGTKAEIEVARLETALAKATDQVNDYQALLAEQPEDDTACTLGRLAADLATATEQAQTAGDLLAVVSDTRASIQYRRNEAADANAEMNPLIAERGRLQVSLGKLVCDTCKRPFKGPEETEAARVRAQTRLGEIAKALDTLMGKKITADRAVATTNLRLEAQERELQAAKSAGATADGLRAQIAQVQSQQQERARARTALQGRLAKAEDEVIATEAGLRTARWAQWSAEVWVRGFGRDGLQAEAFARAMPLLNQRAADYSQALTGGTLRVSFSPLRTSKREDLILIEGASAPTYDGLSTGERKRVGIILALCLRALAQWRRPAPINLVVFDEVFDGIDEGGLQAVATLLTKELPPRGTVIVVTHDARFKQLLPAARTIHVLRHQDESSVVLE